MTASTRWLRYFHPAPHSAFQVICFPHAGGSASYYRPLSAALTPTVELVTVQYPGRQDRHRDPLPADLPSLAAAVAAELGPPDGRPRAFFGHSMGAVVAFETARLLGASAAPVTLFASGRRAPSCHRDEAKHLLSDAELAREVVALGGTEAGVLRDPELRELVLPVVRADYRLVETYRYDGGAPLGVPIVTLTGDGDPQVTEEEADAWRRHTTAEWTLRTFSGGHFFVGERPEDIAKTILAALTPA